MASPAPRRDMLTITSAASTTSEEQAVGLAPAVLLLVADAPI